MQFCVFQSSCVVAGCHPVHGETLQQLQHLGQVGVVHLPVPQLHQAYCVVMDRAHTDMSTSPVDNSRHSSGLLDLQVLYVLWESRAAMQWGWEKWENLVIACCKIVL